MIEEINRFMPNWIKRTKSTLWRGLFGFGFILSIISIIIFLFYGFIILLDKSKPIYFIYFIIAILILILAYKFGKKIKS